MSIIKFSGLVERLGRRIFKDKFRFSSCDICSINVKRHETEVSYVARVFFEPDVITVKNSSMEELLVDLEKELIKKQKELNTK